MGVESFYVVSKISNNKSPSEILKCLENRNFSIVRHTLIFGSIFKKKVTSNTYIIEFLSTDRFLACRPGGHLIYKYEDSPIWEQAINPIMQALGFEYNCDGECLRPGTESGWRD